MAKFAIKCPHCDNLNQASTFIFAKKVIKCGACGRDIDTKAMRLASRICPHCGEEYVYDQSQGRYSRCPGCGTEADNFSSDGDSKKMITVNCPQCACACHVKVTDSQKTASCPVCGADFDIQRELAKAKLVSDTGVSVIQYEGDNSTFVWKHPVEDFNLGSQLIVHESQEAIFFLNGEALDTFGPGRHTLETENLPVLKKIYNLPTGNQTPFHAEVYFINLATQMGMKWGTDSRVRFIDPETNIPLDIGASGEMNLQVKDSRRLLVKLVGTTGGLVNKEVLSAGGAEQNAKKALQGFFRAPIMTQVKAYLASTIAEQRINIMEIDSYMGELSEALRERISPAFEEYGLLIPQFYITNISLPEDDKNFKALKELRAGAYIGVKREETKASIAEAARQRKLVEAQTEAQLKMVRAQGEAEAAKAMGLAEAEIMQAKGLTEAQIMQAKGYTEKDVLAAEVQKSYAEGLGNMGSGGGGGGGGGLASDLVGLMAGMKMAGKALDQFENAAAPTAPTAPAATWACECGESANTKGFCMSCGKPKPGARSAGAWDCPACGEKDITSRFCPNCGAAKPESTTWDCPACGAKGISSRFCPDCGAAKPEAATWDCPACGAKGITSKFCPDCGGSKPE